MGEVYAFEWCDCVFESAFGVESLHATKAGAWRALRERVWQEATEAREGRITYGRLGMGRGEKWNWAKAWRVRRIEVMP